MTVVGHGLVSAAQRSRFQIGPLDRVPARANMKGLAIDRAKNLCLLPARLSKSDVSGRNMQCKLATVKP